VDTKKIVKIRSPSITSESKGGPALQQEEQEFELNEAGISLFVDEDRVP
jgi:hypothetical protein